MKAFPNMTGQQGMDLRDYFATQAMQAYLTGDYDLYPNEVAEKAYQVADWMMETRKAK